jgi:hypothetical protein
MVNPINMFLYRILSLFAFVLAVNICHSQTAEEFEAEYNKRIREEMIHGVYIPVDLEDAFNELNRLAEGEGLALLKSAPEEDIYRKLHFGLGQWILTNWGLEQGSRISHFLKLKGVPDPEDMVRVIIVTWHRKLNNKPILLEEEIAAIAKINAEEKAKRDADKKVISIEKRPHKE